MGSILISCSSEKKETQVAEGPKAEWIEMFNGQNLENWTPKIYHHETGDNYQNTFRVVDGAIEVNYDDYNEGFNDRYGNLCYKQPFSSFHMTWEYSFTEQWREESTM